MESRTADVIPADAAVTLAGLFHERVRRTPQRVAYLSYEKDRDDWVPTTWDEMATMVGNCQTALAAEAYAPGERVAILMRNSREWVMFDQAALGLGLVVVPLYTDDRPDSIAYILRDAGVRLLAVQDEKFWRRIGPSTQAVESLHRIVVCGSARTDADLGDDRARPLSAWLPAGNFTLRQPQGKPTDLASIVYTSGTTGRPKGVMLSHSNMLTNAHGALLMEKVYAEDCLLSFLPLSHTLERTCGYYLPMMAGSAVAYARSVHQLTDDLKRVNPTMLVAVPRIFERAYVRIQQRLARSSRLARALFRTTVHVGWHRFLARQGLRRRSVLELLWPLLERLVARRITSVMGSRLRMAVSGGAALPPMAARTLIGLGINIVQGYGLTEASPIVSANSEEDNRPESVGVPLGGIEVRIGAGDELLVRGPGIMLGYWHNDTATREVIDDEGWLHTGDQAHIDADRHIYITGRLKDILVLSNGEKVPPEDMEIAIALDPLIEQALIVGEGKSFLSALVVLNPDEWRQLASQLMVDADDDASLRDNRVLRAVIERTGQRLKDFPGYAKIRRVVLTLEPWTVDNGLVTPTLKLKRARVLERFAADIEAVYAG